MKYHKDSKYRLKCPECGSTNFYYKEARMFKVRIVQMNITPTINTWNQESFFMETDLGSDYPRQFSGDPAELEHEHNVVCSKCHRPIGTGYNNKYARPDAVYPVRKPKQK